jgi:HK97 family phage prohead protease
MDRAYSIMRVKSFDDEERVIEGIASTPEPDRTADIVEPYGAKFKLPMPLLLDHDHKNAVGVVEVANVTPKGIAFKARIAKIAEPGEAKDLVDKAWQLVKHKLRAAVSIGFRPLEHEILPTGGIRFKAWEWFELSLVAVPANSGCTITTAKRFDQQTLARLNPRQPVSLPSVPTDVSLSYPFNWDAEFQKSMAGLEQRAKDATDELRGISSQSVLAAQHGLILTLADQIQRLGLVVEGSQQQHAAVVKIHNNLHRSLKAHKALQYKGVFNPGATYEHGNFVSHQGSLWHCDAATTTDKPGENNTHWTLAVKRGRSCNCRGRGED